MDRRTDDLIRARVQRTFDTVASRTASSAPGFGVERPPQHIRAPLAGALALAVATGLLGGLLLRHPFSHGTTPAGTTHPVPTHMTTPVPTLPVPARPPFELGVGAVDPDGSSVLVFGDERTQGALGFGPSETWRWNGTWHELALAVQPPPRTGALMASDPARHEVVLFGGFSFDGHASTNYTDTWVFDGTSWAQLHPRHHPLRSTFGQASAYDPVHRQVLLLDGYGATWTWDGSDWTAHTGGGWPTAVGGGAMAWDPASGRVVLLAGEAVDLPTSSAGNQELNGNLITQVETWSWNGRSWTRLHPRVEPSLDVPTVLAATDGTGVLLVTANTGKEPGPITAWRWAAGQWERVSPRPAVSSSAPGYADALVTLADGEVDLVDLSGRTYGDPSIWRWSSGTWSALAQ